MDYNEREKRAQKYVKVFLFTFAIPVFILGVYLMTPVATGHVIGDFDVGESSIIGIVLVVIAIFGFYFYSKLVSDYF